MAILDDALPYIQIEGNRGIDLVTLAEKLIFDGKVGNMSKEDVKKKLTAEISKEIRVKKPKTPRLERIKPGVYKTFTPPTPKPTAKTIIMKSLPAPKSDNHNLYTGKAGEYYVMSELLHQGYNVNNMTIDEGIDIVASKDNQFYYIQVKTAYLDKNLSASFSVRKDSFSRFESNNNVRYVFVIRYENKQGLKQNRVCSFDNNTIKRFAFEECIGNGDPMSVRIIFDENTYEAFVSYKGKAMSIGFYMDKII